MDCLVLARGKRLLDVSRTTAFNAASVEGEQKKVMKPTTATARALDGLLSTPYELCVVFIFIRTSDRNRQYLLKFGIKNKNDANISSLDVYDRSVKGERWAAGVLLALILTPNP